MANESNSHSIPKKVTFNSIDKIKDINSCIKQINTTYLLNSFKDKFKMNGDYQIIEVYCNYKFRNITPCFYEVKTFSKGFVLYNTKTKNILEIIDSVIQMTSNPKRNNEFEDLRNYNEMYDTYEPLKNTQEAFTFKDITFVNYNLAKKKNLILYFNNVFNRDEVTKKYNQKLIRKQIPFIDINKIVLPCLMRDKRPTLLVGRDDTKNIPILFYY